MRNLVKVLTVFLLVFVVGCSSGEDNGTSVADSVLSGRVQGLDFMAKGGKAFDSGEKISVNITNVNANCDSNIFDFDYKITVYVKKEIGTDNNANVIFKKKGETPLNQLQSTVIVDEVTDNSITVRIKSGSLSDNKVEGKFTVPYCK